MADQEPQSMAEYAERFNAAASVAGFGLDVHQIVPCPFCAAPGWAVWYPAGELAGKPDIDVQMSAEKTCRECGRSGRAVVDRRGPADVSAEFVQTGGDDPPPWMQPPPRRVSA